MITARHGHGPGRIDKFAKLPDVMNYLYWNRTISRATIGFISSSVRFIKELVTLFCQRRDGASGFSLDKNRPNAYSFLLSAAGQQLSMLFDQEDGESPGSTENVRVLACRIRRSATRLSSGTKLPGHCHYESFPATIR